MVTAHKVEVKGVARSSRPGSGRDDLATLPQFYEQFLAMNICYSLQGAENKLFKLERQIMNVAFTVSLSLTTESRVA